MEEGHIKGGKDEEVSVEDQDASRSQCASARGSETGEEGEEKVREEEEVEGDLKEKGEDACRANQLERRRTFAQTVSLKFWTVVAIVKIGSYRAYKGTLGRLFGLNTSGSSKAKKKREKEKKRKEREKQKRGNMENQGDYSTESEDSDLDISFTHDEEGNPKAEYRMLLLGMDKVGKTALTKVLSKTFEGNSNKSDNRDHAGEGSSVDEGGDSSAVGRDEAINLEDVNCTPRRQDSKQNENGDLLRYEATMGFIIRTCHIRTSVLVFKELGGNEMIRPYWDRYFDDFHACVFMVDGFLKATGDENHCGVHKERIHETKESLRQAFDNPNMPSHIPVLVLVAYFDKNHENNFSTEEVETAYDLKSCLGDHEYSIKECFIAPKGYLHIVQVMDDFIKDYVRPFWKD
eukprot:Nk52_evm69s2118 gene=Nk52_evmTU69s2118